MFEVIVDEYLKIILLSVTSEEIKVAVKNNTNEESIAYLSIDNLEEDVKTLLTECLIVEEIGLKVFEDYPDKFFKKETLNSIHFDLENRKLSIVNNDNLISLHLNKFVLVYKSLIEFYSPELIIEKIRGTVNV